MAALRSTRGMVATSQPDAARAGLAVLRDGGSAVDAAITMAACLTVVEPCSNGLGSDAFALVWDPASGRVHGLNGSGRAPAAADADTLRKAGLTRMPLRGWRTVTVPGVVAAWASLHERFGRLPFARLLAPAVELAERGFAVTPVIAASWAAAARSHPGAAGLPQAQPASGQDQPSDADSVGFAEWSRVFTPAGRAPAASETWRSPDHAASLRTIAETHGESFYRGALAARIAAASGGWLTTDDLATHASEWVEPISTTFAGRRVWQIPPSGQGIAVLEALNILTALGADRPRPPDVETPTGASVEATHRAIEAIKLALTDAHAFVGDPARVSVPTEGLLSQAHATERASEIGDRALESTPGRPPGSDTVYLCAADADGQLVSFIQSNFHGFGSHLVVPGTGISLQNRGHGFSLVPGHPNELAAGRRPFHTIIPGFLTSADGRTPIGPFGVMGGHMQAQGHVQVLLASLLDGADPQDALDRPRWFWDAGRTVELEDAALVGPLRRLGHDAKAATARSFFGRGQIIWVDADGYVGGSERRCDGVVLGL